MDALSHLIIQSEIVMGETVDIYQGVWLIWGRRISNHSVARYAYSQMSERMTQQSEETSNSQGVKTP